MHDDRYDGPPDPKPGKYDCADGFCGADDCNRCRPGADSIAAEAEDDPLGPPTQADFDRAEARAEQAWFEAEGDAGNAALDLDDDYGA